MTVKELIEMLSGYDEDMEVGFQHPSHDYWRSVLITEVDGVEEGYAKYSEYHQQLCVATEEEIEEAEYLANLDDPDEEGPPIPESKRVKRVLVLS
jgi:hypothetical protein